MSKHTKTTAKNLEARFEAGVDVLDYFVPAKAARPNHAKNRVNVDMPVWMIQKLDRLAGRTGIARQALIKAWLAERIKAEAA